MRHRNESNVVSSPCLILAHADRDDRAALARPFRRLGWDVYLAQSGPEVRRLAHTLEPDAIVLHVDLPEESGWLTCDKLTREPWAAPVILLSDDVGPRQRQLADFVGARALLHRGGDLAPRIEALLGLAAPAAG